MASFEYSPFVNPYAASIGELLLHQHDAAAHAAEAIGGAQAHAADVTGQAWAGAAQGVGQAVGGAIQTATDPRRQLEAEQLRQTQNTQKFTGVVNNIVANLMTTNPDGSRTIDRTKAQAAFAQANVPLPVQQATFKQLDDLDASVQKFQKLRVDHAADAAHAAIGMIDAGMDPQTAVAGTMSYVRENGMASDQELAPLAHMVANASSPDDIKRGLIGIRGLSENYKDLSKPIALGREGSLVSPTGTVLTPAAKPQPTEAALAADAANPNSPTRDQSAAAVKLLKPERAGTAEQDDQRYRDLVAAQQLNKPIAPEDAAWMKGYVAQKTIGIDRSASVAADRQARTIAEQNALTKQRQDFEQAQAGRKELTEKVEQPLQTALGSAQTLRDVVSAAKAGNKVAASLQPLETTMSAIRAQGLNRINSAEIGVTQNAGSLYDNIVGRLGKLAGGEPVPADLQKDMTDFAGILEKAAYKKYSDAWDSTVPRYKLADEKKLPPPGAPADGETRTVNGVTRVWGYHNGQWGWALK